MRYSEGFIQALSNVHVGNTAVVGVNWGDEGKGRIVDFVAKDYNVVVRYQGGGNAGHTVINEYGKFALHLLPSGIFRKNVVNVLGNGVALDIEGLVNEIEILQKQGVDISPRNLKVSDRASIVMPWHKLLDKLEEKRLGDKRFGSTKQGIAPFYGDKYQKKTILAGELLYSTTEQLREHVEDLLDWKNLTIRNVYQDLGYTMGEIWNWIETWGEKVKPYICDTSEVLRDLSKYYYNILFEAQLGTLRDLDFGIHPFTTSSNVLAAYAPIGCGAPFVKVSDVLGVAKAYSTCVGAGPFVSEWTGEEAEELRKIGNEYGATTGRPRRVGPIDIVATRYGALMQGVSTLALTKLDVLSYMDDIPICLKYRLHGKEISDFPFPSLLDLCSPVYISMPGWKCDISHVRKWQDLPKQAQDYVEFIEKKVGIKIQYVSVGPERDAIIVKKSTY